MYPAVKYVTPYDDYTLFFVFENGEQGSLDMKPFLDHGIFRKLKNLDAFKNVQVNFDTIEWSCGVDLDPEYIYEKCLRNQTV